MDGAEEIIRKDGIGTFPRRRRNRDMQIRAMGGGSLDEDDDDRAAELSEEAEEVVSGGATVRGESWTNNK